MQTARLFRLDTSGQGTFGVLTFDDFAVHSLELPNRDNAPNVSCIPPGEYNVKRRYSPSFKRWLYWVKDVPNRSWILIHGANFAGDVENGWQSHLQGCITLGMNIGTAKNKYGNRQKCVFRSREAIRHLQERLANADFKLIIKDFTNGNIA